MVGYLVWLVRHHVPPFLGRMEGTVRSVMTEYVIEFLTGAVSIIVIVALLKIGKDGK